MISESLIQTSIASFSLITTKWRRKFTKKKTGPFPILKNFRKYSIYFRKLEASHAKIKKFNQLN